MNGGRTGWAPGLLQDDCRELARWFSTRLDARWLIDKAAREGAIVKEPAASPRVAGQLARIDYEARCRKFGREIDPITADEEFWRAYRRAEGQTYYAGD